MTLLLVQPKSNEEVINIKRNIVIIFVFISNAHFLYLYKYCIIFNTNYQYKKHFDKRTGKIKDFLITVLAQQQRKEAHPCRRLSENAHDLLDNNAQNRQKLFLP